MEEPVFSPDGKYMWTGYEWVPSPPNSDDFSSINDSIVMGNINNYRNNSQTSNTFLANPMTQNVPIVYPQGRRIDSGSLIIGIFSLVITALSYSQFQNSICGTFLSPLAGDDCTIWSSFNYICGGLGILFVIIGLIGNTPKVKLEIQNIQQPSTNYVGNKRIPSRNNQKNNLLVVTIFIVVLMLIIAASWGIFLALTNTNNSEYLNPDGDFDNDGIINSEDSDDDNDGFEDWNDWYDKGNGGIEIKFTEFRSWSGGDYDSGGNLPDVYAYVGIGDSNCGNMEYFSYLDDINQNADVLFDWKTYTYDFDEDETSVCIEVTLYDEDSWDFDDILDFVPGQANYYRHQIDLSTGEGNEYVNHDNRGENDLSVKAKYSINRIAIDD